ncbi:adaptin ear-binding coat-associated protein-like protein 1 [Rhizodiscina lignyota]|uniref:Adaptin ear-binding coat-associated protein-like protein 1 n=1 Tax=Rhizodiscina lignyota TaxID=1504668 RepID=A0A9P4IKL1_9PEZI|nr:adaptin ear-binding coat-associated protein-like protein 1 [Rhizodiscina lignyota]
MASLVDPITGAKLPADAIQRILFVAPKVFVYAIPPITSTKGFNAASWTADPKSQIFTARIRILETAIPNPAAPSGENISIHVLLESPADGALFAGCPYTHQTSIEQALDSSRFFAVRVVGDGGMKATLGIGFEERSDAFDFSVSLQDARRSLGLENPGGAAPGQRPGKATPAKAAEAEKKDFSLKEGETITVNLGGRGRRHAAAPKVQTDEQALFSIKPPPPPSGAPSGAMPFLPPPPSAKQVKAKQAAQPSAQDLGFDDGEFGEFQ